MPSFSLQSIIHALAHQMRIYLTSEGIIRKFWCNTCMEIARIIFREAECKRQDVTVCVGWRLKTRVTTVTAVTGDLCWLPSLWTLWLWACGSTSNVRSKLNSNSVQIKTQKNLQILLLTRIKTIHRLSTLMIMLTSVESMRPKRFLAEPTDFLFAPCTPRIVFKFNQTDFFFISSLDGSLHWYNSLINWTN